MLLETKTSSGL